MLRGKQADCFHLGSDDNNYVLPPIPGISPLPATVAINQGVPTPIGTDRLHDEEGGCGALTGWSWTDEDDNGSGGKAEFNLPFFIKDGCVERAIVSAGGPKISCDGHSLGESSSKQVVNMQGFDSVEKGVQSTNSNQNHTYIPMDWSKEDYPVSRLT